MLVYGELRTTVRFSECFALLINGDFSLLRLFRMLKLFLSVGTKVVKHYTTVEVHRSFSTGSGFLGDP